MATCAQSILQPAIGKHLVVAHAGGTPAVGLLTMLETGSDHHKARGWMMLLLDALMVRAAPAKCLHLATRRWSDVFPHLFCSMRACVENGRAC